MPIHPNSPYMSIRCLIIKEAKKRHAISQTVDFSFGWVRGGFECLIFVLLSLSECFGRLCADRVSVLIQAGYWPRSRAAARRSEPEGDSESWPDARADAASVR